MYQEHIMENGLSLVYEKLPYVRSGFFRALGWKRFPI